ncbi:MAG: response regulator [Planctomycetaceae bacterium]|nr:response regulator [Planctomycetaceae bacterium]
MAYILIVDDDEDFAQAVATVMRALGHQTRIAASIEASRETLALRRPDLLILDVMFPERRAEGLDLAQSLADDEQFQGLTILILSAVDPRGPLGFGAQHAPGALLPHADFLEKPVDLDVLISKVQALLAR